MLHSQVSLFGTSDEDPKEIHVKQAVVEAESAGSNRSELYVNARTAKLKIVV